MTKMKSRLRSLKPRILVPTKSILPANGMAIGIPFVPLLLPKIMSATKPSRTRFSRGLIRVSIIGLKSVGVKVIGLFGG